MTLDMLPIVSEGMSDSRRTLSPARLTSRIVQ